MSTFYRKLLVWSILFGIVVIGVWSSLAERLPPADFTFANESEVKSIDPALVTGQPEGRIAYALFDGLVRNDPETLEPLPGIAKRWEISDDKLTYKMFLRDDARWSDGSPVTAQDFHYSWRRLLNPRTAAEYAYQGWYFKNGRRYSQGGSGITPGDSVEVELNLPPGALNTLRGQVLRGELVRVVEREKDTRDYVVRIEGTEVCFRPTDDVEASERLPDSDCRWCRQVLLDFREVGIEVIDDFTLKIQLEHPTPYLLGLLGFYPLFPVNRHCLETHGQPAWTKAENLVNNGPFRMQFRRLRDRIRLVKNEHYWNQAAVQLQVIDALAVESLTTALNLYFTDKVDWITDVPAPALRVLMAADPPRQDLNPAPFLCSYFYLFNTTRKPLTDPRVRQALSLALDRAEICSRLMPAGEPPSLSLVPPGIPGWEQQRAAAENNDEARRLLAEAGYPEGKGFPRLEILTNTQESHQAISELIRKQWQRELGISVRTRNEEWGAYNSSLHQGKYDIARRGWGADYSDPNTFVELFTTDSEQNSTGWSNPRFDQLVVEATRETDHRRRFEILTEAERIVLDELPLLPIYSYHSKNMVKPHVRGFYNNARDDHPLWAIRVDRQSRGPNEFQRGSR